MLTQSVGLNLSGGMNVSMMRDEVMNSVINPVTSGLIVPEFYNFANASGAISSANNVTNLRTWGMFLDARFNYRSDLYVEFTGRTDWSSSFNYDQPHFYPGANAAWIFTEKMHGAFKDKVLNFGKLRLGAAGAGNNAVPYANNAAGFQQLPFASTNGSIPSPFNSLPTYQIQNAFGDQNLRPELTRELETGFDLSFLRDRLVASFTYYTSYTSNLIAAVPIAPSSGFTYNYSNIGDVTNKGEEFSLRGTPIKTNWGLRWDLFGSLNHNVNEVVSLAGGVKNIILGSAAGVEVVASQGHALGTFYGNDISWWQNPKDGSWHPIVDAATGLPVPTTKPVYMGSYLPKFIASWGTDLSWNGIKLHVLFTTKQGGVYFSQVKELMDVNGTAQETTVANRTASLFYSNAVNQVGSTNTYVANTTKYLPYNYFVNEIGKNQLPGQNVVDGSYIRLKEISLGYKIPQKYYARAPFGALEAGIFGNNLALWTAAGNKYGDPDLATVQYTGNNTGINYSANPAVKQFGLFVKVTF
jgi:outer membrane receptor protein involved in Fe transport